MAALVTHMPPLEADQVFSDVPEQAYRATLAREHVRKLGQFFTPYPIARFMAQWVAGNPRCQTILDPAVGLGVFLRALLQDSDGRAYQLTGYDIDTKVLAKAQQLLRPHSATLRKRDYFHTGWNRRYDGILCNPPYQHFRGYPNRQQLFNDFQKRLGFSLIGLTNLHTLFLLKSLAQLSSQGRAAYILPAEWLNADYGFVIKQHLLKVHNLHYILVFDSTENLFETVLTTSCILLFDNAQQAAALEFIPVKSLNDLTSLAEQLAHHPNTKQVGQRVPYAQLDPALKWHAYYRASFGSRAYRNLVPLSTYGKVMRGIATGDNAFFTFNTQKQAEVGLDRRYLLPCLTKANQAAGHFFTAQDFARLQGAGKSIYLLNVNGDANAAARRYIQAGERGGSHLKHLTRHRLPWYKLEKRLPAPILVTVFNRKAFRFIRNEAGVRNLTCFHSLYLEPEAQDKIDLLMAYLLTDTARELFNHHRREYGDGLAKFEPNDLNQAQVIDLAAIPPKAEKEIGALYRAYRAGAIHNAPDSILLTRLDRIFSKLIKP